MIARREPTRNGGRDVAAHRHIVSAIGDAVASCLASAPDNPLRIYARPEACAVRDNDNG